MELFVPGYEPLVLYAVYNAALEMPAGKLAAQCGHAFCLAYESAVLVDPGLAARYKGTGNGTKVVLYAKNQAQLLRAYEGAIELGLPCELVIDRGHVLPPHFTGAPIITAVGIGPVLRRDAAAITKRLTLTR